MREQLLKDILWYLGVAIFAVVLFSFILVPYVIPTGSMEPTIHANSLAFGFRLPFLIGNPKVERGAIIAFRGEKGSVLVKRVIGLPGDVITFQDGSVLINGSPLEEPYVKEAGTSFSDDTFEVPEGCYFVLGDNRLHSNDSRSFDSPYIPGQSIMAKVVIRF